MMDEDTPIGPYAPESEELINPAGKTFENVLTSFIASADVDTVFGEPIKQRDTLIIPAAEVNTVLGFGMGLGVTRSSEGNAQEDSGGGGGGGGRSFARPVAVIIADSQGVRVEPIFDLSKILLAGITAAAFALGMLARLRDLRRRFSEIERALE